MKKIFKDNNLQEVQQLLPLLANLSNFDLFSFLSIVFPSYLGGPHIIRELLNQKIFIVEIIINSKTISCCTNKANIPLNFKDIQNLCTFAAKFTFAPLHHGWVASGRVGCIRMMGACKGVQGKVKPNCAEVYREEVGQTREKNNGNSTLQFFIWNIQFLLTSTISKFSQGICQLQRRQTRIQNREASGVE